MTLFSKKKKSAEHKDANSAVFTADAAVFTADANPKREFEIKTTHTPPVYVPPYGNAIVNGQTVGKITKGIFIPNLIYDASLFIYGIQPEFTLDDMKKIVAYMEFLQTLE